MIIQATKKLQDLIGIKNNNVPDETTDSMLLWHGNIFKIGRKTCLLVTHNNSYYSVFIYGVTKANMKDIDEKIGAYLQELLYRDKFKLSQIVKMVKSVETISYTKTSDRKVLGVMTDMIFALQYHNVADDELSLAHHINHTPYKRKGFSQPVDTLKTLLN
jgi:hypothetical protein